MCTRHHSRRKYRSGNAMYHHGLTPSLWIKVQALHKKTPALVVPFPQVRRRTTTVLVNMMGNSEFLPCSLHSCLCQQFVHIIFSLVFAKCFAGRVVRRPNLVAILRHIGMIASRKFFCYTRKSIPFFPFSHSFTSILSYGTPLCCRQ